GLKTTRPTKGEPPAHSFRIIWFVSETEGSAATGTGTDSAGLTLLCSGSSDGVSTPRRPQESSSAPLRGDERILEYIPAPRREDEVAWAGGHGQRHSAAAVYQRGVRQVALPVSLSGRERQRTEGLLGRRSVLSCRGSRQCWRCRDRPHK